MDADPASQDMLNPDNLQSMDEFHRALRLLKEVRGLTIREIGDHSGVPPSTISGWLSRFLPSIDDEHRFEYFLRTCGVVESDLAQWANALRRARVDRSRREHFRTRLENSLGEKR